MNHLTQSEVFGRHVGKVIRTARRQLPLVPNNKHLYATIDIVFELKNDKNHKVEHVIRDNTCLLYTSFLNLLLKPTPQISMIFYPFKELIISNCWR